MRKGIHGVGIARVDEDPVDVARVVEAEVRPGVAAVEAFVEAVAAGLAVARVALARAHPDHVRVALVDNHRADGRHRLVVEDRLEVDAAVGRFPQPARGRADVDHVWVAIYSVDGGDTTAHARRADSAGFETAEFGGVDLLGLGRKRSQTKQEPAPQQDEGTSVRNHGLSVSGVSAIGDLKKGTQRFAQCTAPREGHERCLGIQALKYEHISAFIKNDAGLQIQSKRRSTSPSHWLLFERSTVFATVPTEPRQ